MELLSESDAVHPASSPRQNWYGGIPAQHNSPPNKDVVFMLWFAEDLEYLPSSSPTPKTKKCSRWCIQSSNVKINRKDVSDFAA